MTERWALATTETGGARLVPLDPTGLPTAPVLTEPDLVEAVRSRPDVTRWVWRSTAEIYPRLLAAGVPVARCYDIEVAESLLLAHEGRLGEPRSAAAAHARLRNAPVPPDPPPRSAEPGSQSSLFEPQSGTGLPFDDLLQVYAAQLRRHDATAHPGRMRLLTAAESAGTMVAAEMNRSGLPGARTCTGQCSTNCSASATRAAANPAGWPSWPTRCRPPSADGSAPTSPPTW